MLESILLLGNLPANLNFEELTSISSFLIEVIILILEELFSVDFLSSLSPSIDFC